MTPALNSAAGETALNRLLSGAALLAFDYDGTLSRICAHPSQAHVDAVWAARLRRIAKRRPVAVISGRSLADLRIRLGFTPAYVAGNHGAESAGLRVPSHWIACLDIARAILGKHAEELATAGVMIEDKGMSMAVHYRNAKSPQESAMSINRLLAALPAALSVTPGKFVVNITVRRAPDKGVALRHAMKACGVKAALYVGDDSNDESAFAMASAHPHSVAVRIGCEPRRTQARFRLNAQAQVGDLLLALSRSHSS